MHWPHWTRERTKWAKNRRSLGRRAPRNFGCIGPDGAKDAARRRWHAECEATPRRQDHHTAMKTISLLLTSTLGLAAFGCAEQPEPQTAGSTTAADTGGTRPDGSAEQKDDQASSISLSERLRKLCNIDTAYFAFDSAAVDHKTRGALDQLADCFTKGAAKGKRMTIVGHTDERGEETYNMGLGQRRAGSVAVHLSKRGVSDDAMETSSRGEIDASGRDESGWARDRRVDIDLAGE